MIGASIKRGRGVPFRNHLILSVIIICSIAGKIESAFGEILELRCPVVIILDDNGKKNSVSDVLTVYVAIGRASVQEIEPQLSNLERNIRKKVDFLMVVRNAVFGSSFFVDANVTDKFLKHKSTLNVASNMISGSSENSVAAGNILNSSVDQSITVSRLTGIISFMRSVIDWIPGPSYQKYEAEGTCSAAPIQKPKFWFLLLSKRL